MKDTLYIAEEAPWMKELMQTYYEGVPWPMAVAKHHDSVELARPDQHGPYAIGKVFTSLECSCCNGRVAGYFPSRKEHQEGLSWGRGASCVQCGHKPDSTNCSCTQCKTERRERMALEREIARAKEAEQREIAAAAVREHVAHHNSQCHSVEDCYKYDQWAILLALLEQSTNEDIWCITPINDSAYPLTPCSQVTIDALQKVLNFLNFVDPCPSSAHVDTDRLYWSGMSETYLLQGKTENPKKHLLDCLRKCAVGCIEAQSIALDIRSLMLNEALAFLKKTREEYRLPHQVGDKTQHVLGNLILYRPLGEVLYLIWKATTDAAASVQKATISRPHASNLIVGTMERLHTRACNENWVLPSYKRFHFEEQNWLSYVYFNLMLRLPGKGLEYSFLDILKQQKIGPEIADEYSILAQSVPEAVEALASESCQKQDP